MGKFLITSMLPNGIMLKYLNLLDFIKLIKEKLIEILKFHYYLFEVKVLRLGKLKIINGKFLEYF